MKEITVTLTPQDAATIEDGTTEAFSYFVASENVMRQIRSQLRAEQKPSEPALTDRVVLTTYQLGGPVGIEKGMTVTIDGVPYVVTNVIPMEGKTKVIYEKVQLLPPPSEPNVTSGVRVRINGEDKGIAKSCIIKKERDIFVTDIDLLFEPSEPATEADAENEDTILAAKILTEIFDLHNASPLTTIVSLIESVRAEWSIKGEARGRADLLAQTQSNGMQSLYNRIAQLAMTGVHVKTGQKLRELKTSQIVCHAHAELSELYYAITQPEKQSTDIELEIGDVLAILIHIAIRHNVTLSKLIEATNYKLDARFIDERAQINQLGEDKK